MTTATMEGTPIYSIGGVPISEIDNPRYELKLVVGYYKNATLNHEDQQKHGLFRACAFIGNSRRRRDARKSRIAAENSLPRVRVGSCR